MGRTNESGPQSRRHDGRAATLIVLSVAFSALLGTLMQSLIVPIIGTLPAELGTSASATSWLVTAMLLCGAVASAVCGRLADMYGKRRVLLVCLGSLVAGSLLGSFTDNLGLLILARAMQGLAMAIVPVGIGALRDLIAGDRLIRGIALVSAMTGLGGSLGGGLAGLVAQFLPWHWLFAGSAVMGAIAGAAVLALVPPVPGRPGGRLDVPGTIGLVLGLVGVLLAISNGGVWGWGSPATLGCLIGGGVVLLLWGWYELRAPNPLIDLRVASSRPVLFTNLASMLLGFGMYSLVLTGPQLAELPEETGFGLGQTVLVAGGIAAPSAIFALVVPQFAARLIERRGPRLSIVIGTVLLCVSYVVMLVAHSSIWHLVIANFFAVVGVAFCFAALPTLLLRHVPIERSSEANGVNNVFRTVGTSTSAAVTSGILASMLLASGPGAGRYPSEDAFVLTFVVALVACVLVLPAVLLVGREPAHGEQL